MFYHFLFEGGEEMKVINLLISSVIQILLFSTLPLIWWFLKMRKATSFFRWIGFKEPKIRDKKKYVKTVLLTLALFLSISLIVPKIVDSSDTATSQFVGQGIAAFLPALIYSFLQTGLSEEIFFRGFLMRIFVDALGFNVGNFIQGLLFGVLHGVMFFPVLGIIRTFVIVFITGVTGLLLGWINEKQSDGSIVSSWLLHGLANLIASIIAMFNLL